MKNFRVYIKVDSLVSYDVRAVNEEQVREAVKKQLPDLEYESDNEGSLVFTFVNATDEDSTLLGIDEN